MKHPTALSRRVGRRLAVLAVALACTGAWAQFLDERVNTRPKAPPPAAGAGTVAAPAAAAPAPSGFWMRKGDQTVEQMLVRWGKESGWRVITRNFPVIEILDDRPMQQKDFVAAADAVVRHAQRAGYRITATVYSNNVVEITGQ